MCPRGTYFPLNLDFSFTGQTDLVGYPVGEENYRWTLPQLEPVHGGTSSDVGGLPGWTSFACFVGSVYLPELGLCTVALCIDAGICAIVVEIRLHLLCFGVIKLIEMGNISSTPKESSLGHILDMLRSEKQRPMNGSQLCNLAVRSTLQRRGTL